MKLQRQLNNWSCILAAVAMVLDEDQQVLIQEIGHSGDEIVLPTLPEPARRHGFHLQELVECVVRRGFAFTPIEILAYSTPDGKSEFPVNFPEGNKERLLRYMQNSKGILTGLGNKWHHAVAWDGKQIYDPHGFIYFFHDLKIKIDCFWLLTSIEERQKCKTCGEWRPLYCFRGRIRNEEINYESICQECVAKRHKDYILHTQYNLSRKNWENLRKQQNNKCVICQSELKNGNFAVDHDHKTGEVRGLLCQQCNQAIGLLYDDIEIMESAIRYIKRHKIKSNSKNISSHTRR